MAKKNISINYQELEDASQLDHSIRELIDETKQFVDHAYAPYSNFRVSACLLLESGKIIKGANVENASYPISTCAERVLLSHTISNYPHTQIRCIAIYVDKELRDPVPPCGMCRQSLFEAEQNQKSDIRLYLVAKSGKIIVINRCADLLPLSFKPDML